MTPPLLRLQIKLKQLLITQTKNKMRNFLKLFILSVSIALLSSFAGHAQGMRTNFAISADRTLQSSSLKAPQLYTIANLIDEKTDSLNYVSYSSIISQSSTSAPVDTVLKNTLCTSITWTRDSAGNYTGTLVGKHRALASNKLQIIVQNNNTDNVCVFTAARVTANTIRLRTTRFPALKTGYDGLLNHTPLEIRVFY